jgi:leucyl aminopeptidase
MEIDVVDTSPAEVDADVLVFPVADPVELAPAGEEIDRLVAGELRHLIEDGELKGRRGKITVLHTDGRLPAHRVAAAGVGPIDRIDPDSLRTAAAAAALRAGDVGARSVAWIVGENGLGLDAAQQAVAIVEGTALGPHDMGRWKTAAEDPRREVERLILCGPGAAAAANDARRANVVASWTNRCRDFVNAPPNECTPERLAAWAEETAGRFAACRFEALGPEEIRQAGMGALAAVSQGSNNPPRLIKLSYEPTGPNGDLVLGMVGKAITFDAGGLSLKPADRMEEMKSDMGGGAAVLAAAGAIAELEIPLRVLTVVPSCENMPGGHAYRPGDIITALNGKTIEVTNTDAEGRLILADALWHARELGTTHLIDLATLTGAMVVAMGDYYAGLFGNDDEWVATIRDAAEASGDHAWVWPLHETYRRFIESSFADMKNSSEYRQGSPILAARFLEEFVGEGPWAHLDIAGTAYLERGREDYYDCPGATGYGVRLLAELARRLAHHTSRPII